MPSRREREREKLTCRPARPGRNSWGHLRKDLLFCSCDYLCTCVLRAQGGDRLIFFFFLFYIYFSFNFQHVIFSLHVCIPLFSLAKSSDLQFPELDRRLERRIGCSCQVQLVAVAEGHDKRAPPAAAIRRRELSERLSTEAAFINLAQFTYLEYGVRCFHHTPFLFVVFFNHQVSYEGVSVVGGCFLVCFAYQCLFRARLSPKTSPRTEMGGFPSAACKTW